MKRCGIWVALVLVISAQAEAGEIIASIDRLWNLESSSQQTECSALSLRIDHSNGPGDNAFLIAGFITFDVIPIASPLDGENSVGFSPFVQRLTDGDIGNLGFTSTFLCNQGAVLFAPAVESEASFFGASNDLEGFVIDELQTHFLDYELDLTSGIDAQLHVRFDIYGHPVPEPATLSLVLAVSLGLFKKARRAN